MRLGSRFQKNPKPELPHQAHPWQGERAHARQIEFLISRAQPITRQQFLGLPPDAAAVLDGFNQMVVEVARTRNRVGLMRAFALAHSHVTERKS